MVFSLQAVLAIGARNRRRVCGTVPPMRRARRRQGCMGQPALLLQAHAASSLSAAGRGSQTSTVRASWVSTFNFYWRVSPVLLSFAGL